MRKIFFLLLLSLFFWNVSVSLVTSQENPANQVLDEKVKSFLESHRDKWRDLNIPQSDGRVLYDLIIKHNYKSAIEIGTSTGRSAIWIAWALSKTGGKLITIEIDEGRYKQALANFEKAGLSEFIDARLADAHDLVKTLKGPFDFAFCDADKDWYTNYFIDLSPKLKVGGCYTAHNVSERSWVSGGAAKFYHYVKSLKNMETTIDDSGNGISISYKKSAD